MQIHKSINIDSLNNVNIYILSEVRAVILFISIYIYIYIREKEYYWSIVRMFFGVVSSFRCFVVNLRRKKEWEWTLVHQ